MDRVGRYQLLEKLGEGGMGVVYKAYDPLIQRIVAVKQISESLSDAPRLRERFFAEARAAGHLSHRNIVTIYDLGEEDGQPFFAMEFLEGRDLGRLMRSGEPMTLGLKIDVISQAGQGLSYAHSKGVIHRDVKPANVFITSAGEVKVLDFGLARLARPQASELTRTRAFVGTVSYMAPEQIRGEPADGRTDLFALGVVFYELLSGGRRAFETDSFASTLHRILNQDPEPLRVLDPGLPAPVIAIVERSLAKRREDRYQSIDEMLEELAAFRATIRDEATGISRSEARPQSLRGIGGAEVTVADEQTLALPAGRSPSPVAPRTPFPPTPYPYPYTPPPVVAKRLWPPPVHVRSRRKTMVWGAVAAALVAITSAVLWLGRTPEGQPLPGAATSAAGAGAAVTTAGTPGEVATGTVGVSGRGAGSVAGKTEASAAPAGPSSAQATEPRMAERPKPVQTRPRAEAPGGERARVDAQAALADAARARGRAESAGADKLAPGTFAGAVEAEQAAAGRLKRGDYDGARRGFTAALLAFGRAESEARVEQGRRAEQERGLMDAVGAARNRYNDLRARALEAGASNGAPARTLDEAGRRAAEAENRLAAGELVRAAQGFESAATAADEARRQAEEAAKPAALPAPAPPPPTHGVSGTPGTPSTSSTAGEDSAAIADLLGRYASALESRTLARLKRIWPGLGGAQEAAIAGEFRNARAISVRLSEPTVEVAGDTASVTCRRSYRLETQDGQRLQTDTRTLFALRRSASGWVIENVRHEASR